MISDIRGYQLKREFIPFISLFIIISLLKLFPAEGISRRNAIVDAVQRAAPSVVNLSTIIQERVNPLFPFSGSDFFRDFFPDFFTHEFPRTSLGSGVIIDGGKGYILTNYHVVEKASDIKVITSEKEEYHAKIIGSDPRSDLALLKIPIHKRLPEIKMGSSADLMIGETVIAIGNPFGLGHSVTVGVISAVNRTVRTEERVFRHFIQTDASINPGNSGGPLLNINGELIGINTAIYQKAQGIGFAIPIDKAKKVIRELLRYGKVLFPWLGMELQELDPRLKSYFGLKPEDHGLLIKKVYKGSPADLAGIKRGDILVRLDGVSIDSISEYYGVLSDFTSEDIIDIKLFNKKGIRNLRLHASVFPKEFAIKFFYKRTGIRVKQKGNSVIIENIRKGSRAQRAGLREGDILIKINSLKINNIEDLKRAMVYFHQLDSLKLIIKRDPYLYSLILPFL